ncbi:MAG: hypothetical protein PUE27_09840 [Sharpea porci]|uniref:hypothetical protein n=1 Tax=Sharpea porci TaxID=2652286 RepID=UPI00240A21AF|nr:hypothetical protein [Sharpea porci]MDD6712366.1 hypothetical protein [Sharpea porci]
METIIRLEDEPYPFQKEQLEIMASNFAAENKEADTFTINVCPKYGKANPKLIREESPVASSSTDARTATSTLLPIMVS